MKAFSFLFFKVSSFKITYFLQNIHLLIPYFFTFLQMNLNLI